MKKLLLPSLIAAVCGLAGCVAPAPEIPTPDASWKTHVGQLHYTREGRSIVGDVVVRHKGEDFQLEFTKGATEPLLTVLQHKDFARVDGTFARLGWQGKIERAPDALAGWLTLRPAFLTRPHSTALRRDPGVFVERVEPRGKLERLTVMRRTAGERFVFIFEK